MSIKISIKIPYFEKNIHITIKKNYDNIKILFLYFFVNLY